MDFHEIDTKGKLWIQRVSTLPTYAATDIGRILYVTGEDAFYFGTASAFELWGSDVIPAGTKMIFYQNTAPDGWTIDGTVAGSLIGIKGGSAAYNVNGGQLAGTWTQTTHRHTFSDSFSISHQHGMTHNHQWFDHDPYSWDSNGTSLKNIKTNWISDTQGLMLQVTSAESQRACNTPLYTKNFTGSTDSAAVADTISGYTGYEATASTWRPYAAICIVATKD